MSRQFDADHTGYTTIIIPRPPVVSRCISCIALLLSAVLVGLPTGGWTASPDEAGLPRLRFEFAIIGDVPYNAEEEAKLSGLITAINQSEAVFVVHNGDFKSGSSPCTDELFSQRYELFQTFKHPVIYVFADNEWTDCHHSRSDPLERLAKLREVFTQGDTSLG
jgi:hypothetical protein